jgi:hypothetical protein
MNKQKGKPLAPLTNRKPPPEWRSGSRRIVCIVLYQGDQQLLVRVLLDSGSSIPLLSKHFALNNYISTVLRTEQLNVQTFANETCFDIGKKSSYPLLLHYHDH